MGFLANFLPHDCLDLFHIVKTPTTNERKDAVPWFPHIMGELSMKSALKVWIDAHESTPQKKYKLIWKGNIPQRLKAMLWLAGSDTLLTNSTRVRRGLIDDDKCVFCHEYSDSVLHASCDYPIAAGVWMSMENRAHKWMENNLEDNSRSIHGVSWPLLFATTCSFLWHHRKKVIFENDKVFDANITTKDYCDS